MDMAPIFNSTYIVCPHDNTSISWHINEKELLSIYLAALQWGAEWMNKHVVVHVDNMTAKAGINKGSSSSPVIMKMLRDLFRISAKYNFHLVAVFIPGVENILADAASRGNWAILAEHGLSIMPCPLIPPDVLLG